MNLEELTKEIQQVKRQSIIETGKLETATEQLSQLLDTITNETLQEHVRQVLELVSKIQESDITEQLEELHLAVQDSCNELFKEAEEALNAFNGYRNSL